jgi:hypothetical protein
MGGWLDIGTGRIRSRGGCGGFGRNFGGPLDLFANCGYFFFLGLFMFTLATGEQNFFVIDGFFCFYWFEMMICCFLFLLSRVGGR